MQSDRYAELLNTLRRWRDTFAGNLREQIEGDAALTEQAGAIHHNEGVGEAFAPWLERFTRQLAIQFILKTLFIRVLEDRRLLPVHRIRTRDSQQLFGQLTRYLGATDYARFVFRDAAYLLPDLFAETENDIVWPANELAHDFLEEVWRRPDVERGDGWLRYDFRGSADNGFDTRFIGDLYQDIDAEAREYYALLQTPEFISQFILEHTLVERFEELALSGDEGKDFRQVTLIDPTCGSGHFLVDAFYIFAERYLEAGDYPATPAGKAQLARHIIEHHLYGADINPYACALARFRLMLAACDFARPTDLEAFRDQHFNIVHCDSLIPYEDPDVVSVQMGLGQSQSEVEEEEQQRFGSPETIRTARKLFSRSYDVVVGNPPYITVKDQDKRDLYREHYESAYRSFGLVAPFTERFLSMATKEHDGGYVGMIVSNAFAQRLYGKKLVEDVLPEQDLQGIIDLGGVYIPGHGTPTLIMFLRHRRPQTDTVRVLSNLKGEPGIPADPAQGEVWQSVAIGYDHGHGYQDEYVDVYDRPRSILAEHPWQFGGPLTRLYQRILENHVTLDDFTESLGFQCVTRADDVYICSQDFVRRITTNPSFLITLVEGQDARDWAILNPSVAIFPYDTSLNPLQIEHHPRLKEYFQRFEGLLQERVAYGKTQLDRGLSWFEYSMLFRERYEAQYRIYFPEIATHNHFVLDAAGRLFKHSGHVIILREDDFEFYQLMTAFLNTSIVCLCLKQICYNKGAGDDPVRDRYVYSGTYVGMTPVPPADDVNTPHRRYMLTLSGEMVDLARQLASVTMQKLFEGEAYYAWITSLHSYIPPHPDLPESFQTAQELEFARDYAVELRCDIRQRMMFLQEEMDWLAYEMYGLLPHAPLAENYLTPAEFESARLELGQRAFEQAGHGYKGDWPKSWQKNAKDHLPGPAANLPALSDNMQRLIQDRIDVIRTNEDIALLEDPLYKRRWIPDDYAKEFTEALEWWMREMAEWELEQAGRPLHIKAWSRRLMQHQRVRAALEVYTGTPTYDPVTTIEDIVQPEAVPDRPEHYMKPSGLRKLARGEQEFKRGDFSSAGVWKVRGKLNIPRERYIAYTSFEPGWYGWAGWDAEQRAEALVYLLEQAAHAGWTVHHQQCGLRASLRELLPELNHLPAIEQQEFETIAYMCGIRESCFCQAFRDAAPEDRPPGFGEPKLKPGGRKRGEGEQLTFF